ncbi:molybdopterin-synthase adenylyltransferase MoeB [Paraneptunicella aestuarii]|uniref:HesA/MoeB/ThiF family protein n=1 Tax=Paraneptunicella aestuarii TaxID=2831148 RepID=UPI001E3FD688|nr:molybdopterin-synthase adenylyltransferase MoeB [Paraneptunicella aestuarii]UAA38606.1 molybdopterin-synthase adenylyltransferase MoeB [Paraneptunicella aestuarii]
MKPLTQEQATRYSRHIMLPTMDWEGQEKLLASRVLLIGVGGLGCAVAQYLVAAGIGHLILVDDDKVELSNLQRQVLHTEHNVGEFKVHSAQARLQAMNSDCDIQTFTHRLNKAELIKLAGEVDLFVDCSDNLASRNLLNEVSVDSQTPLITGAAIRMEGQVCCFIPDSTPPSPCYACYSRLFGEQELSCMEAGVLAPLVGIIGAMQALEAVKLLSGVANVQAGKLMHFDAATSQWREMYIQHYDQCPICAG